MLSSWEAGNEEVLTTLGVGEEEVGGSPRSLEELLSATEAGLWLLPLVGIQGCLGCLKCRMVKRGPGRNRSLRAH